MHREKSLGICLKTIKYSEQAIVSQIYTEKFGIQTFYIKGVYKGKGKINYRQFQALNLLELICNNMQKEGLKTLYRSNLHSSPLRFFDRPHSQLLCVFMNDFLYQILKHYPVDSKLFTFLYTSLENLFYKKNLSFLMIAKLFFKLTFFLGFFPSDGQGDYFNLTKGCFQHQPPQTDNQLDLKQSALWRIFKNKPFQAIEKLVISKQEKKQFLINLIKYYQIHQEGFKDLKSFSILQTL